MKKTLLFVAMTVLILNAAGCGSCRNRLFGNRAMAAPMMAAPMQQCCPQPVCCPQPCDPCCSGGQQMSAGYDGGTMMMGEMDGMGAGAGCACGQ